MPGRRQAIISTSAGILLIGPLGTNFSEISIGIQTFSKCIWKCRLRNGVHLSRPQCVNPCYGEFIWGNVNMDLHFLSFLKSGMAQVHVVGVVEISPRKGKGIACMYMYINPALIIGQWWCVVSQCISSNGIDEFNPGPRFNIKTIFPSMGLPL